MRRFIVIFIALFAQSVYASVDYKEAFEGYKKVCLEGSFEACANSMVGTTEHKALMLDVLKLMRLNQEFSELYVSQYGEEAYLKFNEAVQISITFVNFDNYSLTEAKDNEVTFQEPNGHSLVFVLVEQEWKLDLQRSIADGSLMPFERFMRNSIGAHLSLIAKIESGLEVKEVFTLGGIYFALVIYDYSDAATKQQLEEFFNNLDVAVASVRKEIADLYNAYK